MDRKRKREHNRSGARNPSKQVKVNTNELILFVLGLLVFSLFLGPSL